MFTELSPASAEAWLAVSTIAKANAPWGGLTALAFALTLALAAVFLAIIRDKHLAAKKRIGMALAAEPNKTHVDFV